MQKKFAVIGLGVFGQTVASALAEMGAEVIAIDNTMEAVENIKDKVAFAIRMDSTDEKALRAQGIQDVDACIVSIGENFESALLTSVTLVQLGVKRVIARAANPMHKRILELVGIKEVFSPEDEVGRNLARELMSEGLIDYVPLSAGHTIVQVKTPKPFVGKKLGEIQLRVKYNLNLITVRKTSVTKDPSTGEERRQEKIVGVPTADMVLEEEDVLVIFGKEADIRRILE